MSFRYEGTPSTLQELLLKLLEILGFCLANLEFKVTIKSFQKCNLLNWKNQRSAYVLSNIILKMIFHLILLFRFCIKNFSRSTFFRELILLRIRPYDLSPKINSQKNLFVCFSRKDTLSNCIYKKKDPFTWIAYFQNIWFLNYFFLQGNFSP